MKQGRARWGALVGTASLGRARWGGFVGAGSLGHARWGGLVGARSLGRARWRALACPLQGRICSPTSPVRTPVDKMIVGQAEQAYGCGGKIHAPKPNWLDEGA